VDPIPTAGPTLWPTSCIPLMPGHAGDRPRGRSPFGPAAPSIAAAIVYAAAVGVWLAFGAGLPGGRWFAVHLFTLGVTTTWC
jgi:hypothetical protein